MPVFQGLIDALPWRRRPVGTLEVLNANVRTPGKRRALSMVRPPPTDGGEYGATGTENYGGVIRRKDPNPNLDNFLEAVVVYDKMRNQDAQINAMLAVLKQPLRRGTWTAQTPVGSDDPVDQAIADFVNSCLFDDGAMESSWDHVLRHILLQLDYGFSVLELVWDVDEQGFYRLARLAPRLPRTVTKWHVDRSGKLLAITQYAPVPMTRTLARVGIDPTVVPHRYDTSTVFKELVIPAEYAAVFSLNREGDNYEGRSILRTCYRNWLYKDQAYHTEGVRLDRFGVGIPVANISPEADLDEEELGKLVDTLKKIRNNTGAFLLAPPGVTYDLLPKSGSTTAGSGAKDWIEHHDQQIARNVLAGFLTMGTDPHGTLGFGSRLTDLFVSSLNGVASGIGGDMNLQIVRKLCDLNFDMTKRKYPRVVCLDLEETDTKELVEALATLAKAQMLHPDDDIERLLRKILKLPELKHESSREGKATAQEGTEAESMPGGMPGQPGQKPGQPPEGAPEGGAPPAPEAPPFGGPQEPAA